jgi:glutamine synthetase
LSAEFGATLRLGISTSFCSKSGRAKRDGPSADTPYETKASLLPKTLQDAVSALKQDPFFRKALGAGFVDYYVHIKNAEIERFQAEVSEWEKRIFRDVLSVTRKGSELKDSAHI